MEHHLDRHSDPGVGQVTTSRTQDLSALHSALQGVDDSVYGADARSHCLDLYKLFVETTSHVSDRREKTNSYFLAINTGLVTLLGGVVPSISDEGQLDAPYFLSGIAPLAGLLLCLVWYRIIHSYRQLNAVKFEIVHALEQRLPIRLFEAEWKHAGRGKDGTRYAPLIGLEKQVPAVFALLYLWLLIGACVAASSAATTGQ